RRATVRKVLYERLGARRRRRMHQHVVDALVEHHPPETIARRLAWHYREIGDWPNTLRWGLHAARDRLARHDHDAAEAVLDHAVAAFDARVQAGHEPPLRARLELDALRGTLDVRLGRLGEGLTRLRTTWALLEGGGEGHDDAAEPSPGRSLAELRFEVALE